MNAPTKSKSKKKPSKTVTEVSQGVHAQLTKASKETCVSMKRLGSLLLEYALGKLNSGEIDLKEPALVEKEGAQ